MSGLGFLPNMTESNALAVSADGSVIVGGSYGEQRRAFLWTQAGGMTNLGSLSGLAYSLATGVSSDGSVVVGSCHQLKPTRVWKAFRWTSEGGMTDLGHLAGGSYIDVKGVSGDGSVVVGTSDSATGNQAFRWTAATGMVGLSDLPGGDMWSKALAVSADGSVVVGSSSSAAFPLGEAFIWTRQGGMVGLGNLSWQGASNPQSEARAVSSDGSVVVGWGYGTDGAAFIWDTQHGMRNLRDVLTNDCHLDLNGWGSLISAQGVSADGLTIIGDALGPSPGSSEAFVAVTPEPATLALLAAGLGAVWLKRRRKA
jgi:probable HAF family extracellular repeat protein